MPARGFRRCCLLAQHGEPCRPACLAGGLTIAPKKHRQIIDFVLNVVFVWERLCWRKGPLF